MRVERRPFGNMGFEVSEVSLGAMNLRMLPTIADAETMVNYTLDQGINLIDTARVYNGVNGAGEEVESEVIVSRVLAARKDITEPIVIITKGHGYNPKAFDEDLGTSLAKLQVEKKDGKLYIGSTEIRLVYFFHGIKEDRWQEIQESGVIEYAKKRQAEGDFTYLGFSSHYGDGKEIKEAIDTGAFQVMELPYNVYNRSIGEDGAVDLIRYANEKGMAIINMKAFNGNGMVPMYKQVSKVSRISYEQMLRFCLSNPYITTVDAGCRWPSELEDDIRASQMEKLSEEERNALKEEADIVSPHLDHICRECMHCFEKFECPVGLNFPKILGLHARYSLAQQLKQDTAEYKAEYAALDKNASMCAACGQCVPWCEYHLEIPEMMQKAHEALCE